MQLSGTNGDGLVNLTQTTSAALPISFALPDTYGLVTSVAKPSLLFDATTGWLEIAGNADNNIVKQTITNKGYYQFDIDGSIFSSDHTSKNYSEAIGGATKDSVLGINFDGGLGYDTLILGSQKHTQNFDVIADEALKIDGQISANSIFLKSQDIVNQGAIVASNITAEFSRSYSDVAGAKITASNGGSILLNGGQTGNLQAQGEFFATGATGGKIDFRGKSVNLIGANLDASGRKSGGTILVGGDYQGSDLTGLGLLSNAQTTFVDQNSRINANAMNTGDGGKVIIWADGDTDFRGSITAQGGNKSGDGGFVEVSGKQNLNFLGTVNVGASNGNRGTILLDPTDIVIDTENVSHYRELEGNIVLSASNSIQIKTRFDRDKEGSITVQSGGDFKIDHYSSLIGFKGDINIFAITMILDGVLSAPEGSMNVTIKDDIKQTNDGVGFGSISSSGTNTINVGGSISMGTSGVSSYGDIKIVAGGDILLYSGIYCSGSLISLRAGGSIRQIKPDPTYFGISGMEIEAIGAEKGGNIQLLAKQDISIYAISSYSRSEEGKGGNVSLVSTMGSITRNVITYDKYEDGVTNTYSYEKNLAAYSDGGIVKLKAFGDIFFETISTSSNRSSGGSVEVISQNGQIHAKGDAHGIDTSNYLGDSGGNITLKAGTSVHVDLLRANGMKASGNVSVLSKGNIEIRSDGSFGGIESSSGIGGKSGNISIKSTEGSIVLDEISAFGDNEVAGKVVLEAGYDIFTSSILAEALTIGKGSSVRIISHFGTISQLVASLGEWDYRSDISTSSGVGVAGDIFIQSSKGIDVGNIHATSGLFTNRNDGGEFYQYIDRYSHHLYSWFGITKEEIIARSLAGGDVVGNGGKVTFTSGGDIESGMISTDSKSGAGGNIKITAAGQSVKIVNAFTQDDTEYSLYSAGVTRSGKINITQSGETDNYFEIGDANSNGTKGGIYAGINAKGVENSLSGTTIVVGTYLDGNIKIVTPDSPANLTKAKQLAAEKPTSTYTFTTVPSPSKVQDFINKGEYEKAIVALDNLRTVEFYQDQGNTTPTVPQLNSVSKIKNFLTAGDNATGSKSAMIYTFLSTNQTNPNGSALNLFAVTTTDVIYKTIPLINGQYQKLVAGQYQNFDLDTTITDFRSEVKSTGTNENGEFLYFLQAADLYDVLFRPLKSALSQVDNLVFSTDNLFRTIPFAALYDNRTSDNDGTMHLVEKYSSSIAPSFQVIEKSRYTSLKSANVLKMGAREFSGGWDPLPSARTELENIARIESQNAPTVKHSPVYMNKQFSKNNLKTFIAKNDAPIIHLATHGKYVGDSQSSYVPSQSSYIALGTNTPNGFDGLTQAELRQLQDLRNKDLLVFSACDTLVGGGGGMAGAALVAGVKSAIGCRWVVSDEATMVTMTGFYQQLLGNGLSKTKALQEAQKAMILGKVQVTDVAGTTDRAELSIDGNKVTSSDYGQKNIKAQLVNPNRLNHPLYWAAFSLVGNPW